MKIIDSHCHPQLSQYDADRDDVIKRSLNEGIGLICIGTNLEDSKFGIEIARANNNVWATVGTHPNDIFNDFDINQFRHLLLDEKVIAVGEVGLDYYRTPEIEKQNQQKKVFSEFIDLAKEYNKPIVIHSRDAGKGSLGMVHKDCLSILRDRDIIGVAHSFTGTIDEAREYLNLGFYLGFNGIITFANQYDELVKFVPLNRMLIETDAPFLAPNSVRGKRNEPLFIMEVAEKISQLKEVSLEEVCNQTTDNCKTLFRI